MPLQITNVDVDGQITDNIKNGHELEFRTAWSMKSQFIIGKLSNKYLNKPLSCGQTQRLVYHGDTREGTNRDLIVF